MPAIHDGNDMTLTSTSEAVKGLIKFGTSAYDEANNMMGIGTDEPSVALEVAGDILAEDVVADGIQVEAITLTIGASAGHVLTSDADGCATWTAIPVQAHGGLTGLADDDHAQYAACDGRAGGQFLTGGTEDGDDLELASTAGAVKGSILFGTSAYDEVNNRLGIGNAAPTVELEVTGDIKAESITLTDGKSDGHVLTSNADGLGVWTAIPAQDHGSLTGNGDDDHTQYAALAGRAGGQVLTGGTEEGDDLELRSTSNQVGFGRVRIGAHGIVVDEGMSDAIGLGCDPQPGAQVQLTGDGDLEIAMQRNSAPASPGGDLSLSAGSPLSGETDQDGGDVVLSTGSSTGTGTAKVQVKAAPPGTTGTDDNAPVVALEVRGDGNVLAGPQAGVAQDAASGFLCIPIIATGDPTGSPASIPAGMAAIGYVAATGKLAIWDGSAWKLVTVGA